VVSDDLTLLLTLDVQAVGQDALESVAAGLQTIATQSGLALQAVTPLGDAFAGVLAALDRALGNFVPEAVTRGAQIVGGLWQGIDSLAGWLTTNVPVWLDTNILTPVETFFGISGVSVVMAGIGVDLVQGLMDGMTGLAGALLAATSALVAPLPAALLAFQADFSEVGASLMESVRDGILAKAGEIADQARAVVQGAIDAARSVLGGIESSIGAAQATLAGLGGAATVGHNAGGTDFWRGGLTWVGENGPELVNLPRGAQVLPLNGPAALPPGTTGGTTINISVSGNTVLSDQDADLLASRVGQAIVRQTGLAYSLVR